MKSLKVKTIKQAEDLGYTFHPWDSATFLKSSILYKGSLCGFSTSWTKKGLEKALLEEVNKLGKHL